RGLGRRRGGRRCGRAGRGGGDAGRAGGDRGGVGAALVAVDVGGGAGGAAGGGRGRGGAARGRVRSAFPDAGGRRDGSDAAGHGCGTGVVVPIGAPCGRRLRILRLSGGTDRCPRFPNLFDGDLPKPAILVDRPGLREVRLPKATSRCRGAAAGYGGGTKIGRAHV